MTVYIIDNPREAESVTHKYVEVFIIHYRTRIHTVFSYGPETHQSYLGPSSSEMDVGDV